MFNYDSWVHFSGKTLNKFIRNSFVIFSLQSILLNEIIKINVIHIRSCCHIFSYFTFTRGFWSQYEHCLWKNSIFCLLVYLSNISSSINFEYFSKSFIVINYWQWLIKIILNSFFYGIWIIIWSTTGLCSF